MPIRRRPLRWTLLAALLTLNCGRVAPRPERIILTGDVAYSEAEHTDQGCSGGFQRQAHRSLGASAAARYETRDGNTYGVRVRGMSASVLEVERAEGDPRGVPDHLRDYGLVSMGANGSWEWKHVGFSLGVTGVVNHTLTSFLAIPYQQLRLGDLDLLWLELTGGTEDPLLAVNLASIGLGMRLDRTRSGGFPAGLQARAGISLHGKVLQDVLGDLGNPGDEPSQPRGLIFAQLEQGGDASGYLEVRYAPPSGGLGFDLGLQGMTTPSMRLGLSYTLPVDDGPTTRPELERWEDRSRGR